MSNRCEIRIFDPGSSGQKCPNLADHVSKSCLGAGSAEDDGFLGAADRLGDLGAIRAREGEPGLAGLDLNELGAVIWVLVVKMPKMGCVQRKRVERRFTVLAGQDGLALGAGSERIYSQAARCFTLSWVRIIAALPPTTAPRDVTPAKPGSGTAVQAKRPARRFS